MLNINLLPIAERKSIRLEQWRRFLIFFTILASVVLVFGSVLLFPAFLPMFFEQRELQKFLKIEEENYKKLKIDQALTEIKSLKSRLATIKNFVSSPAAASPILEEVMQIAGAGVNIRQVSVSGSGTISISGTAMGRRELLIFEEALKSSPRFEQISSPLSDIIRGAASFTIQGHLKSSGL